MLRFSQFDAVVVRGPPEQVQALLLSDARSRLHGGNGDIEGGQVPVVHGPGEQAADFLARDAAGCDEPGVEVGMGEAAGTVPVVGEPGKGQPGGGELLLGVDQRAVGQWMGAGLAAHPWQLAPSAELE
jgi:hypothetical protein